ncbi:DUF1275 family protein [Empedobacter brevis]|uniref:DUF1275 family protein n=1 Tax=Empedobacter brevis TaxID=247 RepID=UPI0039C878A7
MINKFFFYKRTQKEHNSIKVYFLKLAIISCFFLGGIIGGFLFPYLKLYTLLFPIIILCVALRYDRLLFRYYLIKRKIRNKHSNL